MMNIGPEVADFARLAGLEPDARQCELLDQIFTTDEAGLPATFEVPVAGSYSLIRSVFTMSVLGWLFLTDEKRVLWSASSQGIARDAFQDMRTLINGTPELTRRTVRMRAAHGDEEIEARHGPRLIFRTRRGSGHRGFAVTKLLLDEPAEPDVRASLLVTLAGQSNAQVLYGIPD